MSKNIALVVLACLNLFGVGVLVGDYRGASVVKAGTIQNVAGDAKAGTTASNLPVSTGFVDSAGLVTHPLSGPGPYAGLFNHYGLAFKEELASVGVASVTTSNGSTAVTFISNSGTTRVYLLEIIVFNTDTVVHYVKLTDSVSGALICPEIPLQTNQAFILDGRGDCFTTPGGSVNMTIDGAGTTTTVGASGTYIKI